EAYIDLRNAGAGTRKVQIAVTSKNSQVTIAKIDPAEVEVELQPVRKKMVTLTVDVQGKPAKGYSLDSVKLKQSLVTVSGAETFLKKIASTRAQVILQGTETKNMTKKVQIVFYDENDLVLEGLTVEEKDLEADVLITEVEGTKDVGVKASVSGAVVNGTVKKVEINPAVVSVTGSSENLGKLEVLETAPIDLKSATESFETKVKLVLPNGITLAPGQPLDVSVKVEIEKP
ncbi:MAG: CdaR family protein, partial [Patescibacteria group bacterium]